MYIDINANNCMYVNIYIYKQYICMYVCMYVRTYVGR